MSPLTGHVLGTGGYQVKNVPKRQQGMQVEHVQGDNNKRMWGNEKCWEQQSSWKQLVEATPAWWLWKAPQVTTWSVRSEKKSCTQITQSTSVSSPTSWQECNKQNATIWKKGSVWATVSLCPALIVLDNWLHMWDNQWKERWVRGRTEEKSVEGAKETHKWWLWKDKRVKMWTVNKKNEKL